MHEKFDEEIDRQSRRLGNEIFKPPVVAGLADIRRLLSELDPRSTIAQSVSISSQMTAQDEEGKRATYAVSANSTSQSKRSIVIEGFKFVKARMELAQKYDQAAEPVIVNGKEMSIAMNVNAKAHAWIDPLLVRWFNATREGLFICWTVPEGKFLYDPFEHKLFRAKQEADATTDNRNSGD